MIDTIRIDSCGEQPPQTTRLAINDIVSLQDGNRIIITVAQRGNGDLEVILPPGTRIEIEGHVVWLRLGR